ncbi:zf-TFIIB domain-containing protein [Pontiella sp.]|uniref:zf-TFIIB domain-containing protein n=1 Tax=Pontiella sp. TaxID=2837462 RepID=UPI003562DE3A
MQTYRFADKIVRNILGENMNCPVDQCEMSKKTKRGLTVRECPECRGIWLPVKALPRATTGAAGTVAALRCPACGWPMEPMKHKGKNVHACTSCMHAWIKGPDLRALYGPVPSGSHAFDLGAISEIIFDIAFYAPELFVGSAKGLVQAADAAGDAVVDFFADLFSDIL